MWRSNLNRTIATSCSISRSTTQTLRRTTIIKVQGSTTETRTHPRDVSRRHLFPRICSRSRRRFRTSAQQYPPCLRRRSRFRWPQRRVWLHRPSLTRALETCTLFSNSKIHISRVSSSHSSHNNISRNTIDSNNSSINGVYKISDED